MQMHTALERGDWVRASDRPCYTHFCWQSSAKTRAQCCVSGRQGGTAQHASLIPAP